MNYSIEHNEVEDAEIEMEACGCIFDGETMYRCEEHEHAQLELTAV